MKKAELRTGYQFLQKPKVNPKDYTSWAGPFILFFENIYNRIFCPYTHCFTVAWIDGDLWVFEAVSPKYHRIKFEDKIKEVGIDRLLILIPNFEYNEAILINEALKLVGLKYDYRGLIISEGIEQLTDGRLWIGSRNADHRVFCSKGCSYLKFKSTMEKLFTDYFNKSPNDLFQSKLFKHELLEI